MLDLIKKKRNGEAHNANEIKEIIKHEAPIKHKLTHRELHIQFWILKTESLPQNSTSISEIHQYPFPIVIADFIKNNLPAVF